MLYGSQDRSPSSYIELQMHIMCLLLCYDETTKEVAEIDTGGEFRPATQPLCACSPVNGSTARHHWWVYVHYTCHTMQIKLPVKWKNDTSGIF